MAILHVIYDPYCGWCYGASGLVEASRGLEGLDIQLHGGGMLAGNNRRQMTREFGEFIRMHIARIETLGGEKFGAGYHAMLNDETAVLDSTPPTMAIVAAGHWGRDLDMLHAIQKAHFIDGARIHEPRVLAELAAGINIAPDEFLPMFATAMQSPGTHIRESRELLGRVGGQGFPTFALQRDEKISLLPHANYFGKNEAWRIMLMHSS